MKPSSAKLASREIIRNVRAFVALERLKRTTGVRADEIGFFSTGRIGDNVYLLLLSKAIKDFYKVGRLKIVVPKKLLEIARLWPIDDLIAFEDALLELICFSKVGHIYGLRQAQPGRLNCAHPGTIEKLSGIDGLNFLTLVKYQVGLNRNAILQGPTEPPQHVSEGITSIICREKLRRGIVVSLESRAIGLENSEKLRLLELIFNFALRNDRVILFNENEWYKIAKVKYETHRELIFSLRGFSLLELFTVAKICGHAFLVRSGLADLLALSDAKTVVYYPDVLCHAYDLKIHCKVHFSMDELKQLNPNIHEILPESVQSGLDFLLG